jgi:hypothetical protein
MATIDLPQGWTWEGVIARLGDYVDLEESAREHGAIRRTRVIKNAAQLLRVVLAYVVSGLSLRGTVAWAEAAGEASFSDVALLKRLRSSGPWLAELAGSLGAVAYPEASCGFRGRRIVAIDATAICSPGGQNKSYQLLHTVYDIGAHRFSATELTDRSVAEHLDVGTIEPGEIRIGDKIYARYRDLAAVAAGGADYVVRLSATALKLQTEDGKPLDRAALCKRAEVEGIQDVKVLVCGGRGQAALRARVIVLPLPEQQAETSRRRMRKNACSWGYTPSESALDTAGCVMLITSLEASEWSSEQVLDLYRLRWQVELAFKRLKSLLKLEGLRAFDAGVVSAWVHAVLLISNLIDLERPSVSPEAPDSPRSAPHTEALYQCGASSRSSLAA